MSTKSSPVRPIEVFLLGNKYGVKGEAIIRADEMTIDVQDGQGDTLYLVSGLRESNWYVGRAGKTFGSDSEELFQVKWSQIGRVEYAGLWLEAGEQIPFFFRLAEEGVRR